MSQALAPLNESRWRTRHASTGRISPERMFLQTGQARLREATSPAQTNLPSIILERDIARSAFSRLKTQPPRMLAP